MTTSTNREEFDKFRTFLCQFSIEVKATKFDKKSFYLVNDISCPQKYENNLKLLLATFKNEIIQNKKQQPTYEFSLVYLSNLLLEVDTIDKQLYHFKEKKLIQFDFETTNKSYFNDRDLSDIEHDNEEFELYGEFENYNAYYPSSKDFQSEKLNVFYDWHKLFNFAEIRIHFLITKHG
jgi:hypothetical protein